MDEERKGGEERRGEERRRRIEKGGEETEVKGDNRNRDQMRREEK